MNNKLFTQAPTIEQPRSKFMRNSTHKTTFNAGKLVPIYVDEVLPGDTFNINMAGVVRASTPMNPVMDMAYLDTYAFFVPNRLVWDGWEEFMGANKTTYWKNSTKKLIPQVSTTRNEPWTKGGVADHFGLPLGITNLEVSALPFRAYGLIWNEFFRDQNLQAPVHINTGDATGEYTLPTKPGVPDWYENALEGGELLPVNKYHDYFTSCLPEAQKGEEVGIGLKGLAPVFALNHRVRQDQTDSTPLNWARKDGADITFSGGTYGMSVSVPTTNTKIAKSEMSTTPQASTPGINLVPDNLWADLGQTEMSGQPKMTINDLRLAFQIQRALERDARSGTRYTESIEAHFGVANPDARLQRPEFLGGGHHAIAQQQVEQTTNGTATKFNDPTLGALGAYSLTNMQEQMAMKSFTEHGHVIILACVRHEQTYSQNIERMWNRKERFDFYHPVFANLGEQAVLRREAYVIGNHQDDETFGFQEHWAEYRYKPSKVSGDFNSINQASLDSWHYGYKPQKDHGLTKLPFLNDDFIVQQTDTFDRTMIVKSSVAPQFIADFFIQNETTRTMPLYSVPGLIDHN